MSPTNLLRYGAPVAAAASLLLLACIVIGDSLPFPWSDEGNFLAPSVSFAHLRGFDAGHLLDPAGIYWLPPLIYVVNGAALVLAGDALGTARAASLTEILGCLVLLALVMKTTLRGKANWLDLAALAFWGINIQLFVAANTARPEALCLLLDLAALAMALRERMWSCLSLAVLAALAHQLLALPALAVAAAAILQGGRSRPKGWDLALVGAAGLAVLTEAARFFGHGDEYLRQFAFQLHRKAQRPMTPAILVSLAMMAGAFLVPKLPRSSRLCLVFACANLLAYLYGREMWYGPFLVTALFGFLLCARSLPLAERLQGLPASCFLAAIAASWLLALVPGLKQEPGFAGQPVDPASLRQVAEDRGEVRAAIAVLLRENQGDILAGPSAYADFVSAGGGERAYTYNNFSAADGRRTFTLHVDVTAAQIHREDDLADDLLTGYRCATRIRTPTKRGRFEIDVMRLEKTGGAGSFQACPN